MNDSLHRDPRVGRYLLGELPEGELATFEQDYFADAELFEQVWDAEYELVDRYVRGRLAPRETGLFEKNYLQSPAHRARVASARAMLPVIERPAQAGTQPESGAGAAPKRKSIQRWFGGPAPSATLQGALAAALVLAAALSLWLAFDRIRLKERLGGAATELSNRRQAQAEIESRLAAEQAARGRLESEIARLRQEILGRATRPGSGGQGRVVSLVLSAVLVRGAGTSQEINLTPAAEWVRLELKVGEDETGSFRAEVRTVEGSRIWSRGSIRPDRSAVILEIPASNLAAGDYILILSAERAGRTEEVNRYFFRIYRAERSPNQ